MSDTSLYTSILLCTHFLNGRCSYGMDCVKMHPKNIAKAKAMLSLKRTTEVCCDSNCGDSDVCGRLHLIECDDVDPDAERLDVSKIINDITVSYNRKLTRFLCKKDEYLDTDVLLSEVKEKLRTVMESLK